MEEFKQLTGLTNSPEDIMALKWSNWQPRVFAYAKMLKKSNMRDLMDKVQEDVPNGTNGKILYALVIKFFRVPGNISNSDYE